MVIGKDMVTVVIPTFNEEEAIGLVLDEVRAAGYGNVLVVDGYSVDGTVKVAESRDLLTRLFVFRYVHNSLILLWLAVSVRVKTVRIVFITASNGRVGRTGWFPVKSVRLSSSILSASVR